MTTRVEGWTGAASEKSRYKLLLIQPKEVEMFKKKKRKKDDVAG